MFVQCLPPTREVARVKAQVIHGSFAVYSASRGRIIVRSPESRNSAKCPILADLDRRKFAARAAFRRVYGSPVRRPAWRVAAGRLRTKPPESTRDPYSAVASLTAAIALTIRWRRRRPEEATP